MNSEPSDTPEETDDDQTVYVRSTKDVTDEIIDLVWDTVEGFHLHEDHIDWDEVWDRVERYGFSDGRDIDLGSDLTSPALAKIQRKVREIRKHSGV